MRQSLLPLHAWPTPCRLGPDPQRVGPTQTLQRAPGPAGPSPPTGGGLAALPARPGTTAPANDGPAGFGRSARRVPAGGLAAMNLTFIEYQPQKVLAAFRHGEFDGLEVIGQADERDFFQRCFQERLLARLADSMPTARKKEEVARGFILAASLSLNLHQEHSFLAFERVVRSEEH